jgi:protein-S-isoprenylcysteine O-methyltransferase Ste14
MTTVTIDADFLARVNYVLLLVCWFAFAALFIFRKRPPRGGRRKRDIASLCGVALVGVGYALVWWWRRPEYTPLFSSHRLLASVCALLAMVLCIGSVWLVLAAVRTLGKQWSIAAQIVEHHELVTTGVYAFIRNPIYAGMLGMMLATGLTLSYPVPVLVALVLGYAGTMLRIAREERLLLETFGAEFAVYARRVPALVPWTIVRRT